jgi:hypothetical protein
MTTDDQAREALAANPFPPNPWVQVNEDGIIIKAGYSDALQRMLRWVPKVEWSPQQRQWKIPLSGADLVRSILPEISRLAEATHEEFGLRGTTPERPTSTMGRTAGSVDETSRPILDLNATEQDLFRSAARLLYGTDWQRDTARALGRDEHSLACWLVGDGVLEDDPQILLAEMLALMHRRSAAIATAADQLAQAIDRRKSGREVDLPRD